MAWKLDEHSLVRAYPDLLNGADPDEPWSWGVDWSSVVRCNGHRVSERSEAKREVRRCHEAAGRRNDDGPVLLPADFAMMRRVMSLAGALAMLSESGDRGKERNCKERDSFHGFLL